MFHLSRLLQYLQFYRIGPSVTLKLFTSMIVSSHSVCPYHSLLAQSRVCNVGEEPSFIVESYKELPSGRLHAPGNIRLGRKYLILANTSLL